MLKWLSIILLVCFLYQIREVFPPFIVGGIIAYLLLPLVNWLSTKARWQTGWAVVIIYLLFVICVGVVLWSCGPKAAKECSGLVSQWKEIVTNLLSQLSTSFNYQIDIGRATEDIVSSIEKNFGQPEEIMHLGGLVSKSMLFLLVTIVSSIYFILDSGRVGRFFLRFLPQERRRTAVNLSQQMNRIISKYVQGQLILITLMAGVAYFFLHGVFHLKYALVIAILSGFLEIIPILGPIIATTVATVVGISQIGVHAFWIIPCYIGARWAEDYVIIPRIIGHAVELHPLAVIFAVLCGETMAGALGMLIAIPVAASIKVVLDFCYPPLTKEDIEESKAAL